MRFFSLFALLIFFAPHSIADQSVELQIKGMTCGSCAMMVTKELKKIKGVQSVDVDVKAGKAVVVTENEPISDELWNKAITTAGYQLSDVKRNED